MKTDPVMNAIANLYAIQLFDVISATTGKEPHFYIDIGGESCRMDVDNVKAMREILDSTLIEPLLEESTEPAALFLAKCVGRNEPTAFGYDIWFSVLRKIGSTLLIDGELDG